MPIFQSVSVTVPDVVYDHMLIEINGKMLFAHDFEYRICTKDLKLVRQGSFRGPNVQIRLSLMATGTYQLLLSDDGREWQQYVFEKKVSNVMYAEA